jgi:hypothetical protein
MKNFQGDIPVVLYRIVDINNIYSQTQLNDFIKVYFLHCFVQRDVLALVMSHLQVDYFY